MEAAVFDGGGTILTSYLGIVIAQSLQDPGSITEWEIAATRPGKAWTWHLVAVPAERLAEHIAWLQARMVTDDYWYAHFFRGDELVVVYRDAAIHVGIDPSTWGPAVAQGLAGGIPPEQLDFKPRTEVEARAFFA